MRLGQVEQRLDALEGSKSPPPPKPPKVPELQPQVQPQVPSPSVEPEPRTRVLVKPKIEKREPIRKLKPSTKAKQREEKFEPMKLTRGKSVKPFAKEKE